MDQAETGGVSEVRILSPYLAENEGGAGSHHLYHSILTGSLMDVVIDHLHNLVLVSLVIFRQNIVVHEDQLEVVEVPEVELVPEHEALLRDALLLQGGHQLRLQGEVLTRNVEDGHHQPLLAGGG